MKSFIIALFIGLFSSFVTPVAAAERPKLVVGIVVDQMRWDALHLFSKNYGEGGFHRLLAEGTEWSDCKVSYLPAVTAIGHTSAYTGSTPALHGIVANNFEVDGWFASSVADSTERLVGVDGPYASGVGASPRRMLSTTIGDELRMAQGMQGRTVSIALKDRAAILPGGHTANVALWWNGSRNEWVSSTYYCSQLPQWAKRFNRERHDKQLMDASTWPKQLLLDEDAYLNPRDTLAELPVRTSIYDSPMGITMTMQLAELALEEEKLGRGDATDMLCVSISSTDAIGHRVGPDSPLMEDAYVQLDRDLQSLFEALDKQVGKGQWLCFLTGDHAGQHSPRYRQQQHLPAQVWESDVVLSHLDSLLAARMGAPRSSLRRIEAWRLQVDEKALTEAGVNPQEAIEFVCNELEKNPMVQYAFDVRQAPSHVPAFLKEMVSLGYHPGRNGQIAIVPRMGVSEAMEYGDRRWRGTSHALWTPDDTHIPLVIMGAGLSQGVRYTASCGNIDIAPTICQLLQIQQPSACIGRSLLP